MLKRSILILLSIVSIGVAGAAALAPAAVSAGTPQQEVCAGVGAASTTGNGCQTGVSLTKVLHDIINIISIIIGIVAVIMVMIAGFRYITAGGDSGNITGAKQTLTYAIIGLVVAALSQALVRFVLERIK